MNTRFFLIPFFYCFFAATVHANEVNISGDIRSDTSYIDNYFFDSRNISETQEKISASVAAENNSEQYKNRFSATVNGFLYLRNDELNTYNFNLAYDFETFTERNQYGFSYAYSEASDRGSQIDNDQKVTDSTQKASDVSANWNSQLSELAALETNVSYKDVSYSDNGGIDYTNTTLSSFLNYQINPISSLSTGVYTYLYKPDKGLINEVFHYSVIIGGSYQFSEKWSLNGKSSFGRTSTDYAGFLGLSDSIERSRQYIADLNYEAEVYKITLSGSRLEEPSNEGDIQTTDQLGLNYTRELSERRSLSAGLSWRQTEDNNLSKVFDTKTNNYTFNLSMNWKVKENFTSRIFYQYRLKDERSDDVDSNEVGVNFAYHWY